MKMNGESNEELGALVQRCFESIEETAVKEFEDYIREEESDKAGRRGKGEGKGGEAGKGKGAAEAPKAQPLDPPPALRPGPPSPAAASETQLGLEKKKKAEGSLRNLASKPGEDPRAADKENRRRQNVDAATQTPMKGPRPLELLEEELYSAEERREEAARALRACEAEVGRLRRQLSQARQVEPGRAAEALRGRGADGSGGLTLERIRAMMIESRERSLRRAAKTRLEVEAREKDALRSKAAKEAEQRRNIEERRYRIQGRLETLKAQADARRRANEVADTVIRTVLHTKEAGFA